MQFSSFGFFFLSLLSDLKPFRRRSFLSGNVHMCRYAVEMAAFEFFYTDQLGGPPEVVAGVGHVRVGQGAKALEVAVLRAKNI